MRRSVMAVILGGLLCGMLAGCGGGGLSLSGGSVPIGGRTVTGVGILPGSSAAANASVIVKTLPAGASIGTARTDSSGRFTIQNVPTNSDVDIVISSPPSVQLEVVIPKSSLSSGSGALDIGSVDADTSIVSAAIRLEQAPAPEDGDSIVSNQEDLLQHQVQSGNYSVDFENQLINNPQSMNAQALTLMVPTANTGLMAFNQNPGTGTAATALNSLLGYLRAAHNRDFHLSSDLRQSLVNAEAAGNQYTDAQISSALQSAGVAGVTAAQVSSASARERTELPALGAAGSQISAFEALVIAADVNTNGGFQCSQGAISGFLQALLKF